jgi:hypothetical protein
LRDDPVLGFSIRLFRRAGGALLSEGIDCGFKIAVRFGECPFALHQTCVGFFSERFYQLGIDDG